ncbi:acyl carrier protein [Nocardia transvalensis]|uniref:Acyl carrier protein n=1 Tax=Nocardia transvalensis TaxID=37333 RepID=A0A7W9PH93_9NOCA|nr:acyl carrier protein [Nocardia transvalensis]MBB5916011.1 acyl carrier protein [Nocardia transvalensis]
MSIAAEIQQDILEYLESHYGIEPEEIHGHSTLTSLGVDSLGLIAIADMVKKNYGIELDDERIAAVRTFRDFTELLERKLASGQSNTGV